MTMTLSQWLLLAAATLAMASAEDCSICDSADATIANPTKVVPFLSFLGLNNPTCKDVSDIAASVDENGATCERIKAQGNFCGCPEATGPLNICSLCGSDDNPPDEAYETPFGDTCGELDEYMSYLTQEDCESTIGTTMQSASWLCRCPNAPTPACTMCADGTFALDNADTVIPNSNGQTCADARDFASVDIEVDWADGMTGCAAVQAQANFCGCPEATGPVNQCSLCPGGSGDKPADLEYVTPFGDTCGEVDEYVSYMSQEECDSDRFDTIQANNWLCRCPNPVTTCSMCPDGSFDLPDPNLVIPFTNGITCGEARDFASANDGVVVHGYLGDCDTVQERAAAFCGCSNTEASNLCTFCEDGSDPENMNLETPPGDTCEEYNTYFTYFDQPLCDSEYADSIRVLDFTCGCPGASAQCELCPGKSVPDPDRDSGAPGVTCGEQEANVASLSTAFCVRQDVYLDGLRDTCCKSGASQAVLGCGMLIMSSLLAVLF